MQFGTIQKPGHLPGFCLAENRKYILVAAVLASSLGFIDGTVIAIALPAIRSGLGASLVEAQWINNGYLLPLGALILLGGALGDRLGVARVFATGIAIFVAASMICALAPNTPVMIGARVIQGFGAAMMVPGSLALIARAYPEAERGRAIGIWAAASALTTALGPLLGGLALSLGGPEMWRAIFAINLPFGALALYLLLTRTTRDAGQAHRQLDLAGAFLITGGLGLLAWGLTAAAEGHGAVRLAPTAIGAALIAAFLAWEARASDPMVPLGLFRDRTFALSNLATGLIYFAFSTVIFFLPMTLIAGWRLDPFIASASFAPLSVFIPLLSARAGRLADQIGPGPLITAGAAFMALGYVGLFLVMPTEDFWTRLLPVTCLLGVGMGLLVAPLSTAIMASVPGEFTGTASGINNAVGRIAGLVSVAIMGSLVGAVYLSAGGTASFGALSDSAGHSAAMIAAFQVLCGACAVIAALAALLVWLFVPRRIRPDA
ncbi:MAG: MFS transporter [Pseudomonadota bacterium]